MDKSDSHGSNVVRGPDSVAVIVASGDTKNEYDSGTVLTKDQRIEKVSDHIQHLHLASQFSL